jgi:hypothetical protein
MTRKSELSFLNVHYFGPSGVAALNLTLQSGTLRTAYLDRSELLRLIAQAASALQNLDRDEARHVPHE